jgi:hypothetical protein
MKELNKCYLIDNKYIIINYTSSKKIKYDNEKKIDRIINDGYYKINLENIILIVRSILGMENENTFRVTIVYHENITDLVYFSKGKIVKYAKKVENNSSYLDILYTVKKGLNINTNNKDSDFVDLIPNEVKRMNNLENIKDITLKKSDLLLYEIYKLFYCDTPNFFDNNDRIRAQVMMFILSEYGISIDTDIFSLSKDYPKSLKINESMNRLMIANDISKINVRDYYKKDIIAIGKIFLNCNTDELIAVAKYMYISKYRDKNYMNDNAYRLVKKINRNRNN